MRKLLMLSLAIMIGLSFISNLSVSALEDPPEFDFQVPSQKWSFPVPQDVAIDASGNVYVLNSANPPRIQKFDSDGHLLTTWGSHGSGDGQFQNPTGMAVDSNGYVYVADNYNHRIQKFDSSGYFITKWGSMGQGDHEFWHPEDVAVDSNGKVYVADRANRVIKIFDSEGVFLFKFRGYVQGWPDPIWPDLYFVHSLAVDSIRGYIYVTDTGYFNAGRVRKFDLNGNNLDMWGNIPGGGSGDGEFKIPKGLAVDSGGNVYVGERDNHRIQKFDENGNFQTKWGSYGTEDGQFGYDGPEGIAVDSSGNVYVADERNERIQIFDENGGFQAKWFTYGSGDGQFKSPIAIASDSSENVYVVDRANSRIQKFDSHGNFLTKWGSRGSGNGEFILPFDTAVDSDGDLYVVDQRNYRIQKFDSSGTFLTEWGSRGQAVDQFLLPKGVAVDTAGNVYVLDGDFIKKFDSDGIFQSKWPDPITAGHVHISVDTAGNVYVPYASDGYIKIFNSEGSHLRTLGDGVLERPNDVVVDSSGNVYVSDTYHLSQSIYIFNSAGTLLTTWGGPGDGEGEFNYPYGLAVDSSRNVWVADSSNHRIQKFQFGKTPEGNNVVVEDYLINMTIVFDSVIQLGTTSVKVSETNPGEPVSGFRFLGKYYDISTTAIIDGDITITLSYDDADVQGQEKNLKLYHYEEGHWFKIDPVVIDEVNNTITGTVAHLSWFAVAEQTVVDVEIDIKPGSDDNNCIKASSKGTTPVAILSTSDIDISDIDVESIEIDDDEDASTAGVIWSKNSFKKDVNGDSLPDQVFHFSTTSLDEVGLLGDDKTLYLTGQLADGTQIIGSDTIYLAGGPYCLD